MDWNPGILIRERLCQGESWPLSPLLAPSGTPTKCSQRALLAQAGTRAPGPSCTVVEASSNLSWELHILPQAQLQGDLLLIFGRGVD